METKKINGKAIYSPKGKASEYARYAVNFYVGCSNNCDYCYLKKGVLSKAMGGPIATLKKCFTDEEEAYEVFKKELLKNHEELIKYGLFFSFSTDPMLDNTKSLTIRCITYAVSCWVPCTVLTKRADFLSDLPREWFWSKHYKERIIFGFTLTGHNELEPGASSNEDRIQLMRHLHNCGFKTFASIEPVVDTLTSTKIILNTLNFCNHYKIGLMSGKRNYTPEEVSQFMRDVNLHLEESGSTVYWKDSVFEYLKISRHDFMFIAHLIPQTTKYLVDSDYNMFLGQNVHDLYKETTNP